MSFELRGAEAIFAKLNRMQEVAEVKRVVKMNGSELARNMQRSATFVKGYQTGTTKRSIVPSLSGDGLSVNVTPTTEWSPYLEYGTRFMSAQSFIRGPFYQSFFQFHDDLKRLMG